MKRLKILQLVLAIALIFQAMPSVFAESVKITPWRAYPDKTIEFEGFIEEKSDEDGRRIFVIEPNTPVTFNFTAGWIHVYSLGYDTDVREVFCDTISFEKATRTDNIFWYSNDSELTEMEYIKKGAAFKKVSLDLIKETLAANGYEIID